MSDQSPAVFINPFTDFGFKKLFGTEYNKDLLIAFLNALLKPATPIKDLSYRPTEFLGDDRDSRNSIFDVYCHLDDGSRIIVELQNLRQRYFKDRSLYYATFPITQQAVKGKWDFLLDPVYTVGILNFNMDMESPECCNHEVVLLDKSTQKQFYEKLTFFYLEMPKFNKKPEELETDLDRWLYVIKNLVELSHKPAVLKGKIFDKLFEAAQLAALSPAERATYNGSLKAMWDDYATKKTFYEDGHAEGHAEGLAEGLAEGRAEGLTEGQEQKAREIAKNLKNAGVDIKTISQSTGLSEDEIRKL
ncbi:MAG: Rpn family recombination-promoting nuclease/putative transposase [Succinivibrio sp.]|nr:Rpn family recombination-promoting nuclease/putative transposase [Succinivibrio sp.]